jgi:hypothetical protein
MKGEIMNNEQLELGFSRNVLRITVRRQRSSRAQWWFKQMRLAVDSAMDWRNRPEGRPEQIQLIPGRPPSLA